MATRYKAYISYSHADERWAKWLHNALERYRVPRRVAEMGDGKPPLPKRLYPVFRDRSELSSSSDLGASLQDALRESENLVVVCSPAAATSKWLNEEIRFFKSLGRGDRIFCFMVDGSPDANAEDCAFPPKLIEIDRSGYFECDPKIQNIPDINWLGA